MARRLLWAASVGLPMAGFALLLASPDLDLAWESGTAHFWLVFGVAGVTAGLALLMGEAARRRLDARVLLVSLAFFASAGSLALHALATPGVILEGGNAGFELDVPIGLLAAALLAFASSVELPAGRRWVAKLHAGATSALLALLAVWGALSLAELDVPLSTSTEDGLLLGLGIAGLLLYTGAGLRYYALWRARPALLLLAIFTSFVLLGEAMIAIAFARSWHATWWEWHLLMLSAFALVGASVRAEWKAEGSTAEIFADVYLEDTSAGVREVSILFADLQGFTSFSERTEPGEVFSMLNSYFAAVVPAVADEHGGTVDKLIGDAIMVTFNTRGDQPDHAFRAARAGLALQEEAGRLLETHPGWPRFRVGVNSGRAVVGLLGPRGARSYTVVGDVVNVASRLEGRAGIGEVVVGEGTRRALGAAAEVEDRGEVALKGKAKGVAAYRLLALRSAPGT